MDEESDKSWLSGRHKKAGLAPAFNWRYLLPDIGEQIVGVRDHKIH